MRTRPAWLVVVALFLPATAQAHGHTWDFSAGPGYGEGSALWGVRVTLGRTLGNAPPPAHRPWAFVADLTNLKGTHAGEKVTQLSYLFGIRKAVNESAEKHLLMVHVQGGLVQQHQGATTRNDFAVTFGAAYEWIPRGTPAGWSARLQFERAAVNHDVKDSYRASAAVVRRFN
jgi:hypothetical protein